MGGGVLLVLLCGGLAGVVVWFSRRWVRVMYTNWGYAEPGVRVYMYYVRGMVSLFWCVGVFVVAVCGGLFTLGGVVRLPLAGGRRGGGVLVFWLLVNLAGKEKKKPTDLMTLSGFTVSFFANNPMRSEGR
jgi:hypothetical protein